MELKDMSGISLLDKKALYDLEEIILNELNEEINNMQKDNISLKGYSQLENFLNYDLMLLLNTNLLNTQYERIYYETLLNFHRLFDDKGKVTNNHGLITDRRSLYRKLFAININQLKLKKGVL